MSLGSCHQTLVKKTQQKKNPKTKARVQTDRAWDQTEGRKKKRSYELYLLCPRSCAAFASVCGYLFTKGQIAGSARSRRLLASHQSCCSCHSNPASHTPQGPSPSSPDSCILRDPLPATLSPSSLRDLLPALPNIGVLAGECGIPGGCSGPHGGSPTSRWLFPAFPGGF